MIFDKVREAWGKSAIAPTLIFCRTIKSRETTVSTRLDDKRAIAQDEAEYVEIAVCLGLDADWRQEIARKISERHSLLYDDTTCVTALESFYKNVVLPLVPNP